MKVPDLRTKSNKVWTVIGKVFYGILVACIVLLFVFLFFLKGYREYLIWNR